MTVLCGALADVGLLPLLRFLVRLGRSGQLRIARGGWWAELAFDHGQLVAAAVGEERGPGVLEAIVLALSDGDFTFTEGAPPAADNVDADATSLQARVEGLASMAGALMSPTVSMLSMVPQLVEPTMDDGLLRLDRPALNVLLHVDGQRTVEEIATLSPRYLEIAKVSSNMWWNAARDSFSTGLGMLVQAIGSADMAEGAQAFLDKRRPQFPPPDA